MAQSSQYRRRGPGRRFEKGRSGNPGGRPKGVMHVRELAREHTEVSITTLVEIAKNGDKDTARVAAAVALLDRGWGRPIQPTEVTVGEELREALVRAKELLDGKSYEALLSAFAAADSAPGTGEAPGGTRH